MTEAEGRGAVVAEARRWIGTPYHHRAKLRGIGVDCAQLPLAVYAAVGLIEDFDTGEYPPDWHLHRETERYLGFVRALASEIPVEDAGPGDLVLFKFGRAFSHGAIVTAWPDLIHSSRKDGCVVGGSISDPDLRGRPMLAFSIWAVQNTAHAVRAASAQSGSTHGG